MKNKKYTFTQGSKVAIFSYQGCIIHVTNEPDVIYVARETPMIQYLNVHSAIEQMRVKAEERESKGPSVMIVGPTDVGKSTLCRILINYAVRLGHRPIFVDLGMNINFLIIILINQIYYRCRARKHFNSRYNFISFN